VLWCSLQQQRTLPHAYNIPAHCHDGGARRIRYASFVLDVVHGPVSFVVYVCTLNDFGARGGAVGFHAVVQWITTDRRAGRAAASEAVEGTAWKDQPFMAVVASRCEDFVCCAATTIARCAAKEGLKFGNGSSTMYIFLDKVRLCGAFSVAYAQVMCIPVLNTLRTLQFATLVADVVPRSAIERIIPYDLIRSAYLAAYEPEDGAAALYFDEASEASGGRDELRDSIVTGY
jgi:hypothetical protein